MLIELAVQANDALDSYIAVHNAFFPDVGFSVVKLLKSLFVPTNFMLHQAQLSSLWGRLAASACRSVCFPPKLGHRILP